MQFGFSAHRVAVIGVLSVAISVRVGLAQADDPCAAFTWDVRHERTLFDHEPQTLAAGETLESSPTLRTERLYQLQLRRQTQVTLVASPGRKSPTESGYAGLANVTVDTAGVYRVALDQPVWVDVFASGHLVRAKDFQGRPGCSAPHKIVEFELPARTAITLQFSGGSAPTLKVAVTRSPTQES